MRACFLLAVVLAALALASGCNIRAPNDRVGRVGGDKCEHRDQCVGATNNPPTGHCQWFDPQPKQDEDEWLQAKLTSGVNAPNAEAKIIDILDQMVQSLDKGWSLRGPAATVTESLQRDKRSLYNLVSQLHTDLQSTTGTGPAAGYVTAFWNLVKGRHRYSAQLPDRFRYPFDEEHCECLSYPNPRIPYAFDTQTKFRDFCSYWAYVMRAAGVCIGGHTIEGIGGKSPLPFLAPCDADQLTKMVVTGSSVSGMQFERKYKKPNGERIRAAFDGVDAVGDRKRKPSDIDTAVLSRPLFDFFTQNNIVHDNDERTHSLDYKNKDTWKNLKMSPKAFWTFGAARFSLEKFVGPPNHEYATKGIVGKGEKITEDREINMMAYTADTTRNGKVMEILCDIDFKKLDHEDSAQRKKFLKMLEADFAKYKPAKLYANH